MSLYLQPVSEGDVEQYETLKPLLLNMLDTFKEFAKKKPDGILSAAKVKMVNRLLTPIQKLMENEPDHQFLDLLDEVTLPQNSDVVLILGQTLAAMGNYYKAHTHTEDYSKVWTLENDETAEASEEDGGQDDEEEDEVDGEGE